MPYNNLISRTDGQALIPEQVVNDMLGFATKQSAALTMFRKVPVQRNQVRFPVLSALPMSYWVTGDTGLKQTSEVAWNNKYLNIEEIASIIPIPENVAADVDMNVWDQVMPYLSESIGRTLDAAVFFGVNAPASFPSNIAAAALAAGNAVTSIPASTAGGYMGAVDNLYAAVEGDGFDTTGFVAALSARGKLRSARNSLGDKLDPGRISGDIATIDGLPVAYALQGGWNTASASPELFGGDWSQFVLGVRQDVSFKILDQAVITDNTGAIVYNLPQQDMIALRVTFRVGWQVANTINYQQSVEANRYPVGYIALP